MQKLISYPLSFVYYFIFLLIILFFHPIQWICFNWFGYNAHKKSVDLLNLCITLNTKILGTSYDIQNLDRLPQNVPLIIVANHQSLYDISGIIWFMRKVHPKFVSKIELGKGIPSISYNLTHGGSVLIDRKDAKQSLTAIKTMGEYIEQTKRSAVIFPEGTRSKTGQPGVFAENGLKILCKYAPSAYVVPVTINNSWKMVRWNSFPMGLGNKLKFTIHEAIPVNSMKFPELFKEVEARVINSIV